MTSAIPYLAVHDGAEALAFYTAAFGADETERYNDGDRIGHAALSIGTAVVFVSDEYPEVGALSPRTLGGASSAVVLAVPDPDAVYAQAVAAGATADRPMTEDSGGRSGSLIDPYGHRWNVRSESR